MIKIIDRFNYISLITLLGPYPKISIENQEKSKEMKEKVKKRIIKNVFKILK